MVKQKLNIPFAVLTIIPIYDENLWSLIWKPQLRQFDQKFLQCKLGLTGTHGSKPKRSKRSTRDRVPLAFSVEGSKARIIAESHSRRAYFSIDPLGEFIINESIGSAPARWDNRFRNCANLEKRSNEEIHRENRALDTPFYRRFTVCTYTATRDWNSWNANYFNRPVDESLPSDRISIFRGKRCVIPFITKERREFFS